MRGTLLALVLALATSAHAEPLPTSPDAAYHQGERDGYATGLAEARERAAHPPTEARCRAIAHKGETWEDACERVYHVAPDAWSPDGTLTVERAKSQLKTAREALKAARAHEREIKRAHAAEAKRQRALKRAARQSARCNVETDPADY